MATNNSGQFGSSQVNLEAELYYLSLLPRSIVNWLKYEAVDNFNAQPIVNLYQDKGEVRTLRLLRETQALATAELYSTRTFKGRHPQGLYE